MNLFEFIARKSLGVIPALEFAVFVSLALLAHQGSHKGFVWIRILLVLFV